MEFVSCGRIEEKYNLDNIIADYLGGSVAEGSEVTFRAHIYSLRIKKWGGFVIVRTNRRLFQCVADASVEGVNLEELREECYAEITGKVVNNPNCRLNPGFEIAITGLKVISSPAEVLPFSINKESQQWNDKVLFDNRAVTMRNYHQRCIFRVVSCVMNAFRTVLTNEGFVEFVAPKLVQAGAEGGADMFSLDYFGQKAYLTQSPQQYKQMMVPVFGKVFTLSPVFRAEKHSTNRHINEFQGLDLEMALESMDDLLALEARMMAFIFKRVSEECADELKELNVTLPVVENIPRIKFADAKALVAKEYNRPQSVKNDLEPEEERLIGKYFLEKYNSEFVFITHYPTAKRPFYTMEDPEDNEYTLSYDLLLNGAEVTTGGQRINDYEMQVAKMKRLGMNIDDFADYLTMHKYCMPPHGGMGIGLERLVMRILNLDNIKHATAFPRDRERLNP